MKERIELFWTVWPSDVATLSQMRRLLRGPGVQEFKHLVEGVTKTRATIRGRTSMVVVRPGATFDGNMQGECEEADAIMWPYREPAPRPAPALGPVERMIEAWPAPVATITQVRRYLNDNRRQDFTAYLERAGAKVLTKRVKLPGEKSRAFLVRLKGELPKPTQRDYTPRDQDYLSFSGNLDHYVEYLKQLDVNRQCAKLAAQAGEQLTGERGNYYPTNGLA